MSLKDFPELLDLSTAEKLRLINELWESIHAEMEQSGTSEEERELLDQRWEEHLRNPEAALTPEQLEARIGQATQMIELRILPEVLQDVAEAVNWYQEKPLSLGKRLLDYIRSSYISIQSNPFVYRTLYNDYRRILLRPFPYAIYFRVQEPAVFVTLVSNKAKGPATAQQVLSSREKQS